MADIAHLSIDKYATFNAQFVFSDTNNVPIDVTGYSAAMQIRDAPNGGNILASFSSPSSGITIGTTDGTVTLTISNTATGGWTFTNAVYDILITDGSGNKFRLVEGAVFVNPGVTQ